MIEGLHPGALLRFEALIHVMARAARARERGAFALYVLDLSDASALRFAHAVHRADPAGSDPAQLAAERPRARGPCLAGSAAVELIATVAAAELGEAIGAEVRGLHAAGSVPVLVVVQAVARVAPLGAPSRAAAS